MGQDRIKLLSNSWSGPHIVERLSAIGITHLFVDHVDRFPVASLAILESPVFENAAFKIYALPPKRPRNKEPR
jgi:hypothetical protein